MLETRTRLHDCIDSTLGQHTVGHNVEKKAKPPQMRKLRARASEEILEVKTSDTIESETVK